MRKRKSPRAFTGQQEVVKGGPGPADVKVARRRWCEPRSELFHWHIHF